jgi:hypothetical protein
MHIAIVTPLDAEQPPTSGPEISTCRDKKNIEDQSPHVTLTDVAKANFSSTSEATGICMYADG